MKKNGFSHIRRWLWGFLVPTILTAALTFLFIHHEIMGFVDSIAADPRQFVEPSQYTALKFKLFILFTTALIIICAMGYLWIQISFRQLNRPIRIIRQALSRLASGKLNETVSLDTPDEFGQIGAGINELAANLQELLLYIWKQTGECNQLLDQIKNAKITNPACVPKPVDPAELAKLDQAIQNLREMAKAYVFYDVRLDGEQALAVNEPGQLPKAANSH